MGRSRNNDNGGAIGVIAVLVISLVVYAISFLLLRLLSRYRELCADRSGAYLTQKPVGAGLGAAQDQRPDERRTRDATCAPPSR